MTIHESINFIYPFLTYLKIFLVTPWYDFRHNSGYRAVPARLYGLFVWILRLSAIAYWTFDGELATQTSLDFLHTQKFIHTFTHANMILLTLLGAIKSLFLDIDQWKVLLSKLEHVDILQNRTIKKDQFPAKFYFSIGIKHVFFVTITSYQIFFWTKFCGVKVLKTWISTLYDLYYQFLVVLLINSLVRSFRSRYEFLNNQLIRDCSSSKFLLELKSVAQTYRILGEAVQTFNRLFGSQIIIIMVQCGLCFIQSLSIDSSISEVVPQQYYFYVFISNTCLFLFSCVSYFF